MPVALKKLAILEAHRLRVASAQNFQEFQEAQVEFLDYLIEDSRAKESEHLAAENFTSKWEEWSNK